MARETGRAIAGAVAAISFAAAALVALYSFTVLPMRSNYAECGKVTLCTIPKSDVPCTTRPQDDIGE